jgi:hypothetical protein
MLLVVSVEGVIEEMVDESKEGGTTQLDNIHELNIKTKRCFL